MTVPAATLRLQFHHDFTFAHAADLVDYFAALGVSHVYASPITTSQPGSMHGYDTVDYAHVNPELGGEAGLRRLVAALRGKGLGLIVDIVPNHMGVGGAHNAWWLDLLEWGPASRYASYFDVDWRAPDPALAGRVLAPFLGEPYGDALAAAKLALRFDAGRGRFHVAYYAHEFPIRPHDYPALLRGAAGRHAAEHIDALARRFEDALTPPALSFADDAAAQRSGTAQHAAVEAALDAARAALAEAAATPAGRAAIDATLDAFSGTAPDSRAALHALLERQHYRLAWWRTAADEINWRRFFDISALAGLRVECDEVFEASHALILRLIAEGLIDGVRIDHVDGLAQPREYCIRLRERLAAAQALRPGHLPQAGVMGRERPYLVVEKILARGEPMRVDWQLDGTTGYDFMNDVGALLHDPAGAEPLARTWAELSQRSPDFADEALIARRKILAENLAAELDRTARALHRVARASKRTRDFSLTSIRRVLAELVAHYPVYRIYPVDGRRTAEDERYFSIARDAARCALRRADHALLEQLDSWLGGEAVDPQAPDGEARRIALTLFSQLTSPTAAKAIEDTACYRYGRLISRNEVGANPGDFALSVDDFHAANIDRATHFPQALLCTATHDHKRGEDVRARLAVLSEMPDEWAATQRAWSTLNAPQRRSSTGGGDHAWAPGPGPESMLYQTLVGCWPPDLAANDDQGIRELAERVAQWQDKALREAKLRTDWFAPDLAYEDASRAFLFDILAPQRREGFLAKLTEFVERIAQAGAINSLQQTLLRLSSPGVPDLYQGTELWDFSLVDPDNRRPVDYALRQAWLNDIAPAAALAHWRDGRVKMAVIARALALRKRLPAPFAQGAYLPLTIEGTHARSALAFARRHGDEWVIVIATRLASGLLRKGDQGNDMPLVPAAAWQDTFVRLPEDLRNDLRGASLLDWLSDAVRGPVGDARLPLGEVLCAMPIALLSTARP